MIHVNSWPPRLLVFTLVSVILFPQIAFVRAQSVFDRELKRGRPTFLLLHALALPLMRLVREF